MNCYRLGVDIGGTFTDAVMMDEASGEFRLVKMSSTPRDPSMGFMDVIERILRESKVSTAHVTFNVHGTTVATNTIIEGKGAKAALIATEGFRDVFEIARQIRPKLYDIFCEKPKPLVARYLCFEVPERLNFAGQVLKPLDEQAVRSVVRQIKREQVESIVVCLLHSYVNPAHEVRIGEIIREEMPDVFVSLSSDLCPEMREYFRASTTAINAVVMPIITRYLEQLNHRLSGIGVKTGLHLMTSAGGIISSQVARREPVHLIESGPAAGVIAATHLGNLIGVGNVISFDMGGTTAKAGLVQDGVPKIAPHFEVGSAAVTESKSAGYPVRTPVMDLVEIGAGGGSIAWIDPGGALRVGPQSGGADPGPACYDKGQPNPCITDANLLLGRINPEYFLGGEHKLYPELARNAIEKLSRKLGLSLLDAANGIIEIANANMVGAIRLISVQRGLDPREFVLVSFGGAGPMHANALARELSIPKVLVPMSPGVTSALGLLVTDIKHDYVQACLQQMDSIDFQHLNKSFREMEERGRQVLASEGVRDSGMSFTHHLDMRYVGQSYELKIEISRRDLGPGDEEVLNAAFFKEHERAYGYAATSEPTEVVNLRLAAVGAIKRPQLRQLRPGGADSSEAIKGERAVYFAEVGEMMDCKVYDRYGLEWGNHIRGPAIVEEMDSTVVIHPGYCAEVDRYGNILIQE
jgi:N-methylhydantoinase A